MHVLMASLGTDGDVRPFVAIGSVLRQRGHEVSLATQEPYAQEAEARGFGFAPLVSTVEYDALLGHPDFWHPLKGGLVAAKWGMPMLRRHYETIAGQVRPGETLLLISPGILAARVVQDRFQLPGVSLILQPWLVPSRTEGPEKPWGPMLPPWLAPAANRLYLGSMHALGQRVAGVPLNCLRAELGLPPVKRLFQWWHSPDRALAMFPAWYASVQADWPPQTRTAGFPLGSRQDHEADFPRDLAAFLDGEEPPVVFTAGTGMRHARHFFAAAVEACQSISRRGLLLAKFAEQLPHPLPQSIRHFAYAPFERLLPRCAALVHHGGVGTVAQALASGIPQLIVPAAYDQRDNARRVKSMGAGDWLLPSRLSGTRLAQSVDHVIKSISPETLRAIQRRFQGPDGSEVAADFVEQLGQQRDLPAG